MDQIKVKLCHDLTSFGTPVENLIEEYYVPFAKAQNVFKLSAQYFRHDLIVGSVAETSQDINILALLMALG